MKHYTIGEIFRLKLLLNHDGKPYTSKGTVSRVISQLNTEKKKTAFGVAKVITESEISKWNKHWI